MAKECPYCGNPIPEKSRKTYCSERCRRDMQNERRRDERAEFLEQLEIEKARPMGNPFDLDFIATLDFWDAAELYANACLDPEPVKEANSYDNVMRVYYTLIEKEQAKPKKMRQGWLMY